MIEDSGRKILKWWEKFYLSKMSDRGLVSKETIVKITRVKYSHWVNNLVFRKFRWIDYWWYLDSSFI